MNGPSLTQIDVRLADLNAQIDAKTTEMRNTALKAIVDKATATARGKLKQELAALTIDRDDLQAARSQALQMDEDDRSAAHAARLHADAMARHDERCRVLGLARQAAIDLRKATEAFLDASRRLQVVRHTDLSVTLRDAAHFLPRRQLHGMAVDLRRDDLMENFRVEDGSDHYEPSLGNVGSFLKLAMDPPAP